MNTLECRAHNYERVELKVVRPPLASFKIPQELAGWKRGKLELNICLNWFACKMGNKMCQNFE